MMKPTAVVVGLLFATLPWMCVATADKPAPAYKTFAGVACYLDKEGLNKGVEGVDFVVATTAGTDLNSCQRACDNDRSCIAFEWHGQCELWSSYPFSQVPVTDVDASCAYKLPEKKARPYEVIQGHACRLDKEGLNKGVEGVDYVISTAGTDFASCKRVCDKTDSCIVFEWHIRCEIWSSYPFSQAYVVDSNPAFCAYKLPEKRVQGYKVVTGHACRLDQAGLNRGTEGVDYVISTAGTDFDSCQRECEKIRSCVVFEWHVRCEIWSTNPPYQAYVVDSNPAFCSYKRGASGKGYRTLRH
jgi:hypothetical protein